MSMFKYFFEDDRDWQANKKEWSYLFQSQMLFPPAQGILNQGAVRKLQTANGRGAIEKVVDNRIIRWYNKLHKGIIRRENP